MSTCVIAAPVAVALADLEQAFPGRVSYEPDEAGGTFVAIAGCALGDGWTHPIADLAFHLPFNYPWAAIYPYYLTTETWPNSMVAPALQRVVWRGRQVIQVSLRHTSWTPEIDTALGCVRQTLQWACEQR